MFKHLAIPTKLINNQNDSIIKADKLKSKYSDIIIKKAPKAFRMLNFKDWLLILLSCSSKYASKIKKTPTLPTKSYQ
jgi:hypothetical protein